VGGRNLRLKRLIPMPEILTHTGTDSRTIDGQDVTSWYVVNPENLIPGEENVRVFTPEELAVLEDIGHDSWYRWCIQHWGTKWNACRSPTESLGLEADSIEITSRPHGQPRFPSSTKYARCSRIWPSIASGAMRMTDTSVSIHSTLRPPLRRSLLSTAFSSRRVPDVAHLRSSVACNASLPSHQGCRAPRFCRHGCLLSRALATVCLSGMALALFQRHNMKTMRAPRVRCLDKGVSHGRVESLAGDAPVAPRHRPRV